MSKNFEDIKNLWQQVKFNSIDLDKLINELNQTERKSIREKVLLMILFTLTLIALMLLLPFTESMYYLIAILLFGIGMLMILFQVYKSKFAAKKTEKFLDNRKYVGQLIKSLNRKMEITSRYMWIYTLLLISGFNLGYIEALSGMDLSIRIIIHIVLSSMILWFMNSAIKKRIKKNQTEILPLIKKLENIERESANA